MKTAVSVIAVLLLGASLPLLSCSRDQEKQEKGMIERQTDKMAEDAVKSMQSPLELAKKAAEQENSHGRELERQMDNK